LPDFLRSPKLSSVTPAAQLPHRSRSLIAWLALVLLMGVGHVVPAFHFLFVAHHLCAEHGELVDAGPDAALLHAGAPAPRKTAGGSAATEADQAAPSGAICSSGAVGHSHEHCEVFAATRAAPALTPAPALAQLLPALQPLPAQGEARDAHLDIALLHYAPKLAPPARA
jgi:hypothetical protein